MLCGKAMSYGNLTAFCEVIWEKLLKVTTIRNKQTPQDMYGVLHTIGPLRGKPDTLLKKW